MRRNGITHDCSARAGAISVLVSVLTLLVSFARAQPNGAPPTLNVGDDAPPLVVNAWLKGGPVERLEKGTVYVLEFWATWCGPCVEAIPHLTRLQAKYANQGVVVIGMNVFENDPAVVEPFVQKMGERIGYSIATDVGRNVRRGGNDPGTMAQSWVRAAGRSTIPTTFIADRAGKIAWIGHPSRIERPLRLIIAGTFDPQANVEIERKQLADEKALDALLTDRGLTRAIDDALAAADRLIALEDGSLTVPTADGGEPYGLLKLKVLIIKEDYAAASAVAAELVETLDAHNDPRHLRAVLNVMEWAPDPKKLNTDLMLRLAKRVDDQGPDDWKAARTLARIHAARGEFDQAITAQRRALAGAPTRDKPWAEAQLKVYLIDQEAAKQAR